MRIHSVVQGSTVEKMFGGFDSGCSYGSGEIYRLYGSYSGLGPTNCTGSGCGSEVRNIIIRPMELFSLFAFLPEAEKYVLLQPRLRLRIRKKCIGDSGSALSPHRISQLRCKFRADDCARYSIYIVLAVAVIESNCLTENVSSS